MTGPGCLFRWLRPPKQRFAVLLHARNLLVADDTGVERAAGAYTWCDTFGDDETAAVRNAISELVNADAFQKEVSEGNDMEHLEIEAEQIIPLQSHEPSRSTGIVFYLVVDDGEN